MMIFNATLFGADFNLLIFATSAPLSGYSYHHHPHYHTSNAGAAKWRLWIRLRPDMAHRLPQLPSRIRTCARCVECRRLEGSALLALARKFQHVLLPLASAIHVLDLT
jgi:hypothetical protein